MAGTAPTLSAVRRWDVAHLSSAAIHWTETATHWEHTFTQLSQSIDSPGGTTWTGHAATAARHQAYSDRLTVIGLADQLHDAATHARAGADRISAAQQAVLAAVDDARRAGFTVGEDFSVSSNETGTAAMLAARQALAEQHAGAIRTAVHELVSIDQNVAGSIVSAATGLGNTAFPDAPARPIPEQSQQQRNQREAFKKVFGREPTSPADWTTAAALDPTSYDPKNGSVPANVVVGRIKPVPGQGVVRTNLFIPGEKAWTPLGDNLGDNRGFDPCAGPEQSRVVIYTDFENGIVVARQNPSVLQGSDGNTVKAGTPDVQVSQNPNGSVLIQYRAADPFSPGGEDLAKATPWNVNGDLVIKPTQTGPIAGGTVSSFPAIEIYNDNAGRTVEVGKIMPENTSVFGPLAGLPLSQQIGPGLMGEFPDKWVPGSAQPPVSLPGSGPTHTPPVARVPIPVVVPYPSTPLGPVDNIPRVPIGE